MPILLFQVTLASHVTTGVQYAVKIVSKMQIISENKVQYVMNEKNILKSLNHPNIIKLISTFQTPDELHYVLEYAEGGELLEYIKKMGRYVPLCCHTQPAQGRLPHRKITVKS